MWLYSYWLHETENRKKVSDDRIWSSFSLSFLLGGDAGQNLSLIINCLRLFFCIYDGYDEYTAWSVLLIRPHVSGDELKIQAPDLIKHIH